MFTTAKTQASRAQKSDSYSYSWSNLKVPIDHRAGRDTAAKRTAHEQNTELPVSVVFPVCNQNLLRKQKIPVARSLKPKLKSYETNLRVKIVSLVS